MVVDGDFDSDGVVVNVDQPAVVEVEHLFPQVAAVERCTHARPVVFTLCRVLQHTGIVLHSTGRETQHHCQLPTGCEITVDIISYLYDTKLTLVLVGMCCTLS